MYHLSCAGEPALILKVLARDSITSLAGEAARLRWLQGRVLVPAVLDFVQDSTHDFLLMSALPGSDAASVALPPKQIVDLLADALRQLHSLPVHDCPFRHTVNDCVAEAKSCLDHGRVNVTNFDSVNVGRDPNDLYREMLATKPAQEAAVFTHGDYCLPNVMIVDERLSGFVDLGRSGIGDPYRDLALIDRTLDRNLGADWTERFFARYGLENPDPERLRFFRLVDEFFRARLA